MSILGKVLFLYTVSNSFMVMAWYLHLKYLNNHPWYVASIASWCIAFFEYSLLIPANRIGYPELGLSKLQIIQIGMSLIAFIPFSLLVMKEPIKKDYILAALCLFGAVYFIFRNFR
ncbi:MAG: DMT family protein [Trichodesmium sp. St15_bin1_1]|nr:DMT family protein [Trichodesmium sp. St16_bin2-tuft]MDE5115020.1 DMT family protein [Trichodesmium sp. St15_bin1_1]MDE5115736.1 DMT family protein [Trichodesmium sp. St2_bin2_1]MDE5119339.1 DMT family protein [Trichodesmium sp. St19_bin1]